MTQGHEWIQFGRPGRAGTKAAATPTTAAAMAAPSAILMPISRDRLATRRDHRMEAHARQRQAEGSEGTERFDREYDRRFPAR